MRHAGGPAWVVLVVHPSSDHSIRWSIFRELSRLVVVQHGSSMVRRAGFCWSVVKHVRVVGEAAVPAAPHMAAGVMKVAAASCWYVADSGLSLARLSASARDTLWSRRP